MTLRAGNIRARDYIVEEFRQTGVKPLHGNSYLDPFPITIGTRATSRTVARVIGSTSDFRLELERDYLPVSGSAAMKLVTGEVVSFGQATPTGELSGKIAMLTRMPKSAAPEDALLNRIREAAKLGARGLVLVGPSRAGGREVPLINRQSAIPSDLGLVAISVSTEAAGRITGLGVGAKIRLITETEANRRESYNVIGYLPGNDPKLANEYIVIGAHFDHLGYGEVGSRTGSPMLHNGADDNGSGTAGLLSMAEYFARTKANRRPIIFQAYSGEEVGLVGSLEWVREFPEFVQKTHLMVNMDMIGRLRDGNLTIFCTQSAAELPGVVNSVKVPLVTRLTLPPGVPGNSDHAGFVRAGVPSLFYHTGLHDEYHTQNDNLDTINYEGMHAVLEHVLGVVKAVDQMDKKLAFVRPGGTPATPPAASGDGAPSRRVRVGFMPDMGGDPNLPGLRLTGVIEGSPAAVAGVKANDILLSFDGKAIKTVEDLQSALTTARPNVTVKIKILRDGKEIEMSLTPVAASQ